LPRKIFAFVILYQKVITQEKKKSEQVMSTSALVRQ